LFLPITQRTPQREKKWALLSCENEAPIIKITGSQ